MGGFIYSPLPADHPTDVDTYWARKAREHNAAMRASREANPVNVPSLHQVYRDNDPVWQAQIQQRQGEIASSPYAFTGQGMPLPRNDPKAIEARLRMINGEPVSN